MRRISNVSRRASVACVKTEQPRWPVKNWVTAGTKRNIAKSEWWRSRSTSLFNDRSFNKAVVWKEKRSQHSNSSDEISHHSFRKTDIRVSLDLKSENHRLPLIDPSINETDTPENVRFGLAERNTGWRRVDWNWLRSKSYDFSDHMCLPEFSRIPLFLEKNGCFRRVRFK